MKFMILTSFLSGFILIDFCLLLQKNTIAIKTREEAQPRPSEKECRTLAS
jgi:hypothetical protein